MRQTGILAACAAYALTHNLPQIAKVHALAKRVQSRLEEIGVRILSPAETCMVCAKFTFEIKSVSYPLTRSSTTRPLLVSHMKRSRSAQRRSLSP